MLKAIIILIIMLIVIFNILWKIVRVGKQCDDILREICNRDLGIKENI